MQRYADFCTQINHTPEWSNVYNRVSVRLHNREVEGVTSKEISIGRYLNTVGGVTLTEDDENELTMESVTEAGNIVQPSLLNCQDTPTSLFQVDEPRHSKRQQQISLTQ